MQALRSVIFAALIPSVTSVYYRRTRCYTGTGCGGPNTLEEVTYEELDACLPNGAAGTWSVYQTTLGQHMTTMQFYNTSHCEGSMLHIEYYNWTQIGCWWVGDNLRCEWDIIENGTIPVVEGEDIVMALYQSTSCGRPRRYMLLRGDTCHAQTQVNGCVKYECTDDGWKSTAGGTWTSNTCGFLGAHIVKGGCYTAANRAAFGFLEDSSPFYPVMPSTTSTTTSVSATSATTASSTSSTTGDDRGQSGNIDSINSSMKTTGLGFPVLFLLAAVWSITSSVQRPC